MKQNKIAFQLKADHLRNNSQWQCTRVTDCDAVVRPMFKDCNHFALLDIHKMSRAPRSITIIAKLS